MEGDDTENSNTTATAAAETEPPYALMMLDSGVYTNQIIVTKTVSMLSAFGSAYIFFSMIIKARRRRRNNNNKLDLRTFDRLLLGLCVSDFVSSTSLFVASWLVPANPPVGYEEATGVPGDWNYMFPQALGNIGTCTAQGFFLYIGVCASVLFTGSIAVSFLLQIKFQFSDRQMRVSERYFFGINTAIPLLAAVLILIDRGFNPIAKGFCYVFTSPMICLKMFKGPAVGTSQEVTIQNYCDNDAEIRGKHSELYSVILFFGPVLVVLLIIVVSMGMLFWTVRTQELRTAQWSAARAGRHQKRVFVQGMLYVSAYLAVWIPYIVGLALYDSNPVAVHYVGSFVLPLQGVLNMLIYSNMFSLFKEDAANVSRSIRNSVRSPSSSMTFGRSQKSFTPFGGSTRPGNCESTEEFQRSVSGKEIRNLGHTSGLPNKNEIIPTS